MAVDALLELIDDIPNVLVLGSPDTAVEYDLCAKLGSADSQPRRRILVSTQKPTVERLRVLDCYDTDSFEETIGIDTGVRDRSHHAESDRSRPLGPETMTIESVRNPRDLTKLGLLINNHLDVSTDGPTTVLCVHSLTTLLNHVKIERLFRFLHVLTGRIRSTQAMGHYHLAPTAHGDEAVQTLQSIFDLTVRFDARGNVSVDR